MSALIHSGPAPDAAQAPGSVDREISAHAAAPPLLDIEAAHVATKPPQTRAVAPRAEFVVRRALKVFGVALLAVVFLVALAGWPQGLIDDESLKPSVVSLLFLVGLVLVVLEAALYIWPLGQTLEDHVGVNKSAIMLMVSASMWTFLAVGFHPYESQEGHDELERELSQGLKDVGAVILFLLPAMGVVESIDHFDGFAVVTAGISGLARGRQEALMPVLTILCFFLSAVIDNLTATIVCLKLLRHSVPGEGQRELRHTIGGLLVIAANAGGAWSPIGDVTTTMLWLAEKITVPSTVSWLFLPSLTVSVVPLMGLSWEARRLCVAGAESPEASTDTPVTRGNLAVLLVGVASILMVPVLKMSTGLPPYLGMLLALGCLWFVTDTAAFQSFASGKAAATPDDQTAQAAHTGSEGGGVVATLHKMDLTGLLFFAGVLLAVGALDTAGVLRDYAQRLVRLCGGSSVLICTLLGVSSAVVDNVPLVQAAISMFGATTPADDPLWQLVALAAGTGGSILSVGSIAGVTLMSMEGVGYLWYCRRVSLWATLGFAAGIGVYQVERLIFA